MAVIQFPLSLLGSDISAYANVGLWQIPPALAVGLAGLSSHYCLANAFRAGDATLVVPLDFMRIPLIAVVGWAFYAEQLDIFVLLGQGSSSPACSGTCVRGAGALGLNPPDLPPPQLKG
jgi:drug/metabolite transporter (DMT)-like permease